MSELKSYIRDINLSLLSDKFNIEYDTSRSRSKYQFLKLNWKLIKYVTNLGGVLTGSRALKCCYINGEPILSEKRFINDFDFLVTKKMAFEICLHFGFCYNLVDNIISIEKNLWTSHHSYTEPTKHGEVNVDLIIVDELPEFIEQNGIRISTFLHVINHKMSLVEEIERIYDPKKILKELAEKHTIDLCNISMKFNLL